VLGGAISGSLSAYAYLPASVQKFPDQSQLVLPMEEAGFEQVHYQNLTGGIAALHMGRRV
jgi:demethylmenaquinone methyltransferase/2-methoxy-6-polyprenyl-1,4-benzoquinol methylase